MHLFLENLKLLDNFSKEIGLLEDSDGEVR